MEYATKRALGSVGRIRAKISTASIIKFEGLGKSFNKVDFPEPFSPTRNVIGEAKLSPSSANSATQGTVYGQAS